MEMYEQLRQVLDAHPATAPKTDTIIAILKMLFTPDEAAIAMNMSFKVMDSEKIASLCSLPGEEAEKLLESMANKGIIYSKTKDGKKLYGLVPLIPGVFEFPFMKSDGSERFQKLGKLWEKYHDEAFGVSFCGNPTPLMRVVPVEKSLSPQNRVHPYEEVRNFIEQARYIAIADCACRTSVGKCDKPKDVCIIFDSAAQFLAERGFARHVTKAEAMDALDRSEKAGLVHTSNNSADRANLICNCCPCCCTVLRGRTQHNHPHAFETSRFEAHVNDVNCTGCGICVDERCPVKAIALNDGVAVVDAAKCIGCGLCVTGCPEETIELRERASIPEIPATVVDMAMKVVTEKGRAEKFIEIMKR